HREGALRGGELQVVQADVVRAALEERDVDAHAQRVAHPRKVSMVELVLQRLGAGGDDHAAAREERRHEVGEGLPGAGAGLRHQRRARFDRLEHGARELHLLRALAEAVHRARERSRRAEDRLEVDRFGRRAHDRPNTMRSSRSSRTTATSATAASAPATSAGSAQSTKRKASPRTMRASTACCPSTGTTSCQRASFKPEKSTITGTNETAVAR